MTYTLISQIEKNVKENSLLQHPFYQAWSKGTLTHQELVGYAKEYYFLVRHIPHIMDRILEKKPQNCPSSLERALKESAEEESEHVQLWERFALSLDISLKELKNYTPSSQVQGAVKNLLDLASSSFEQAVALMYAFELELPIISETKQKGLKEFYSLDSEDAQIYFNEHLKEEKHLKVWRGFLSQIPKELHQRLLKTAKESVKAQHHVLDGVLAEYGLAACM